MKCPRDHIGFPKCCIRPWCIPWPVYQSQHQTGMPFSMKRILHSHYILRTWPTTLSSVPGLLVAPSEQCAVVWIFFKLRNVGIGYNWFKFPIQYGTHIPKPSIRPFSPSTSCLKCWEEKNKTGCNSPFHCWLGARLSTFLFFYESVETMYISGHDS